MATVDWTVGGNATRALRLRIRNLHRIDEFLHEAGKIAADQISTLAPVDSGALQDEIRVVSPVFSVPGGARAIGAGPYSGLGDPAESAPRGTIADFLKDYPEYRRRAPRNKRMAWWYLSREARDVLDTERIGGLYGGADRRGRVSPIYWALQEEGTYPAEKPVAKEFVHKGAANATANIVMLAKQYLA